MKAQRTEPVEPIRRRTVSLAPRSANDAHIKRESAFGHRRTDVTIANDPDGAAGQLAVERHRLALVPESRREGRPKDRVGFIGSVHLAKSSHRLEHCDGGTKAERVS